MLLWNSSCCDDYSRFSIENQYHNWLFLAFLTIEIAACFFLHTPVKGIL